MLETSSYLLVYLCKVALHTTRRVFDHYKSNAVRISNPQNFSVCGTVYVTWHRHQTFVKTLKEACKMLLPPLILELIASIELLVIS